MKHFYNIFLTIYNYINPFNSIIGKKLSEIDPALGRAFSYSYCASIIYIINCIKNGRLDFSELVLVFCSGFYGYIDKKKRDIMKQITITKEENKIL